MKTFSNKTAQGGSLSANAESAASDSGLVTKKVVARAASVSVRCVEVWMQRRLIPFVKLSARCVRFHLPSVLAALRRLEVKAVE